MNTVDDSSYYRRTGSSKSAIIEEFIREHEDIKVIYDVGCNNGNMSYPLQHKLGKQVYGVDASKKLNPPSDYNFQLMDIVESYEVFFSDCTFFLSLYHHVLGWHGLEVADDLFYRLLLRTKYLIFDTGNVSERKRRKYQWHPAQAKLFSSEDELLDHFNLPYTILGEWKIGGGSRKVVMFKKDDFDIGAELLDTRYRLYGSPNQKIGLVDDKSIEGVWEHTVFSKIKHNGLTLFGKKHNDGVYTYKNGKELILDGDGRNKLELHNISLVYKYTEKDKLIKFYGFSERYGILFEWLDNFTYIKKDRSFKAGDKTFKDVDIIEVDGETKVIDFFL